MAGQALDLGVPERAAQAVYVLEHGSPVGGQDRHQLPEGMDATLPSHPALVFFLPLRSSQRIVGIVGIAGTVAIRRLRNQHAIAGAASTYGQRGRRRHASLSDQEPQQIALFTTFCDQIALAIDRFTLQQEAIHAEALRESDRLKDALLGSVTHDLRTPLAAIQASVGSLLEADVTWNEASESSFSKPSRAALIA